MMEEYVVKILVSESWIKNLDQRNILERWLYENVEDHSKVILPQYIVNQDYKGWTKYVKWYSKITDNINEYYFKNINDAILFKLIWGGVND